MRDAAGEPSDGSTPAMEQALRGALGRDVAVAVGFRRDEAGAAARADWDTRFSKKDLAAAELPELTDPSCMAGLLRYSFDDASGKGRLLHTGPDSTKRDHGTVWLSTL